MSLLYCFFNSEVQKTIKRLFKRNLTRFSVERSATRYLTSDTTQFSFKFLLIRNKSLSPFGAKMRGGEVLYPDVPHQSTLITANFGTFMLFKILHLDVEILQRLYDKVDVSELRSSVDWETFLQEGLSFVVDTNEEYNVKGLMEKETVEETNKVGRLLTFEQIQNVDSFTIMLNTISK